MEPSFFPSQYPISKAEYMRFKKPGCFLATAFTLATSTMSTPIPKILLPAG